MIAGPTDRVLFLGAGPQMQCGVGHFTRLLQQAVESSEPGSTAALTLTRGEGSIGDIWARARHGHEPRTQLPNRGVEARPRAEMDAGGRPRMV